MVDLIQRAAFQRVDLRADVIGSSDTLRQHLLDLLDADVRRLAVRIYDQRGWHAVSIAPFDPLDHQHPRGCTGAQNLIGVQPTEIRRVGAAITGFDQPPLDGLLPLRDPFGISAGLQKLGDGQRIEFHQFAVNLLCAALFIVVLQQDDIRWPEVCKALEGDEPENADYRGNADTHRCCIHPDPRLAGSEPGAEKTCHRLHIRGFRSGHAGAGARLLQRY